MIEIIVARPISFFSSSFMQKRQKEQGKHRQRERERERESKRERGGGNLEAGRRGWSR